MSDKHIIEVLQRPCIIGSLHPPEAVPTLIYPESVQHSAYDAILNKCEVR